MNVRVRNEVVGVVHFSGIPEGCSLEEFRALIFSKLAIPPNDQKSTLQKIDLEFLPKVVLVGYPPKLINGIPADKITSLGIQTGSTVTIERTTPTINVDNGDTKIHQPPPAPKQPIDLAFLLPKKGNFSSPAFTGNEGNLMRRIVAADNSCLFNSIG